LAQTFSFPACRSDRNIMFNISAIKSLILRFSGYRVVLIGSTPIRGLNLKVIKNGDTLVILDGKELAENSVNGSYST